MPRDFIILANASLDKVKDEDKTELSIMSLARTAPAHMLESWSENQGTQERSGVFHSWYTDQSLQGKGEQCNSQVSHHRPCRVREPCHHLERGKSSRQRGTVTNQMDKRGTLDQKDTDVHESGCRILPAQPHIGPGDFQVTCSIEL